MLMPFDTVVARERHNDMLREVAKQRLIAEAAAQRNEETLLSRMAKLFAGPVRRLRHQTHQDTSVTPQTLVDARGR